MAALLGGGDHSRASILKSLENTMGLTFHSPKEIPGPRKRRRPPTLEIPLVPEEPPALEEPEIDSGVLAAGSGWAVFSKRGRRKKSMEDFYCADPRKGFFAVFDGHGGKGAAAYAAENLHGNITMALDGSKDLPKEDAIREAFLKTDVDFLEEGSGSGSCCVMALIGKEDIVVSNLGDCRAVLCRGGVAEALTIDHTAKNVEEQKKVQEKGGFIQDHHGTCRVQGVLAVTRSFGDRELKEYLSAEPDTVLLPCSSCFDFLVLASDGIWDKVGNQEVVDAIIHHCNFVNKQYETPAKKCNWGPMEEKENINFDDENQHNYGMKAREAKKLKFGSENWSLIGRGTQNQSKISSPFPKTKMDYKVHRIDCENISPPMKIRRITLSGRDLGMGSSAEISLFESQKEGKESPATGDSQMESSLGGACRKVASIALDRGSGDDITLMIVDMKHFICS